ncbi:MAG: alpha/beta hydrolase [Candidatus Aminicenantes bacterium]|nr:alpha/beta hydrolase [Candidatus Aminicenantes bacterium]
MTVSFLCEDKGTGCERIFLKNLRKYGNPPFRTAVVHGGPGAAGEMAPVAREMGRRFGVMEPLQTEVTLEGQVEELSRVLKQNGNLPLYLVGYSWGAWLCFILAARYPMLVKKLILVGSGPFEDKYASNMLEKRMEHMNKKDREEVKYLMNVLEGKEPGERNRALARLGLLIEKADAFDPLPKDQNEENNMIIRAGIFLNVWREAAEMRKSGRLLTLAGDIKCPVTAIHGNNDPHPAEGVWKPLQSVIRDFRFILLEHCGHKPWIERQARDKFFRVLDEELS